MGQPEHKGEYPPNWPEISTAVKEACGWICVRCKHAHDIPAGYMLTVHHFDGNKSNVEWWNLMGLCQRCHLSIQARVNPEVALIFLPSTWAMPYIAGFYESGAGTPGPTYNLAAWREEYERAVAPWPKWAPIVQARDVA